MEPLHIGPWCGHDPRDADWSCSYCRLDWTGSYSVCTGCNHPRLLTDKEKQQIWNSDHAGEELSKKVIAGEYIIDDLEGMIDAWRVWNRIPVQVVIIDGKRYVLVAIRSDKEDDLAKHFFSQIWRDPKEYTFAELKPLNDITTEVCTSLQRNGQ